MAGYSDLYIKSLANNKTLQTRKDTVPQLHIGLIVSQLQRERARHLVFVLG